MHAEKDVENDILRDRSVLDGAGLAGKEVVEDEGSVLDEGTSA